MALNFPDTPSDGTIFQSWIWNAATGAWLPLGSSVQPADATPLMDGTAAIGSSTDYAREDHRHPTDTSRAPNAFTPVGNIAATTVAGALAELDSEKLPVAATAVTSGNLDAVVLRGDYWTNASVTNTPTADYYYVQVFVQSSGYVLQLATTVLVTPPQSYFRTQVGGVWGAWLRVASTAYVDNLLTGMPHSIKTLPYTCVLADAGKMMQANATGTFTIPANASVAYPLGTTLTFCCFGVTSISIAITTDTLYFASSGGLLAGTRTLANCGVATAIKTAAASWVISGSGLT